MKKYKAILSIAHMLILSQSFAQSPSIVDVKSAQICEKLDVQAEIQGKKLHHLKDYKFKTLIARKVFELIEDSESGASTYIEIQLLNNSQKPKIKCVSGVFSSGTRLSSLAPVIIDLNSAHKIGHAYWHLEFFKNNQGLFSWNHKSILKNEHMMQFLKSEYTHFQFREIQENFIQLEAVKIRKNLKQTFLIEYDVIQP